MFHWREEGARAYNGFNFYRLSDENNAGGVFKLGTRSFWFRYSKKTKTWNIG